MSIQLSRNLAMLQIEQKKTAPTCATTSNRRAGASFGPAPRVKRLRRPEFGAYERIQADYRSRFENRHALCHSMYRRRLQRWISSLYCGVRRNRRHRNAPFRDLHGQSRLVRHRHFVQCDVRRRKTPPVEFLQGARSRGLRQHRRMDLEELRFCHDALPVLEQVRRIARSGQVAFGVFEIRKKPCEILENGTWHPRSRSPACRAPALQHFIDRLYLRHASWRHETLPSDPNCRGICRGLRGYTRLVDALGIWRQIVTKTVANRDWPVAISRSFRAAQT